jgi:hypothetical protein
MIRNPRRFWASLTGLTLTLLPAIGSAAAAAVTPPGLAHSYTGSAHNVTASASGVLKLTNITQNGVAISGNIAFESPLAGVGPFTGTVSSTAINFTAHPTAATCSACASIVFTGTVTAIVSLRGTWKAHLKSGGSQSGTWGVGSTWNGKIHSVTQDVTASLSIAMMTEDSSGNIIGALIEGNVSPGSADEPMAAGTVTGTVDNNVVKIIAKGGCGQNQVFIGTISNAGNMNGTWSYAGDACGNYGKQHGMWQLNRSGSSSPVV